MKSRLLVAAVGVPVVFILLALLPPWGTTLFCAAISVIAATEMLNTAELGRSAVMTVLSAASAVWVTLCFHFGWSAVAVAAGILVYFLLLAAVGVAYYEKGRGFGPGQTGAALMAGAVVPLCFAALICLRRGENGVYAVLTPFVVAFIGDAGALFTGMAFGKHKLAPRTSPKKTVEGAIGGLLCSVVFTIIYGIILRFAFKAEVSFGILCAWSAVGGVVSQLGDLFFSLFKRESGIKDYGTLLSGHGGILDRFDSMATLAPVLALLFSLISPFGA